MRTIPIHIEPVYDVCIGRGILEIVLPIVSTATRILLVSDDTVFALHGQKLLEVLRGRTVSTCIIPHGESSKTIETLGHILGCAAESGFTRHDLMIALGGGVIGDITGFAAAVYMRGIRFIQVPTTLLAAVDASVGGKTAIDLKQGKNLAGAFHQPTLVVCDCELMNTLPERQFANGMAEIVKHSILRDRELLELCSKGDPKDNIEELIERNVRIKRDIVEADPYESGLRKQLNFGHTAGHAVELISDYNLLHGEAVSVGMMIELQIGEALGITDPALRPYIEGILRKLRLPTETSIPWPDIVSAMRSDKKNAGDKICFMIPKTIGDLVEVYKTTEELLMLDL